MKVVLLNSGGIDSLATAKILSEQGYELHSLFVHVGQPSSDLQEIASGLIADRYCVSHKITHYDGIEDALLSPDKLWVGPPLYGHFMLLMGCIYAKSQYIDYLATGLDGNSWDNNRAELFRSLMTSSTRAVPTIILRPLSLYSDFGSVYDIVKDDPLLKKTVSCRQNPKCGVCFKCKNRLIYGID